MQKNVVKFERWQGKNESERDGWKIFSNQVSSPSFSHFTLTLQREFNEFIEATEVHST